jgi:hypothetical protein
MDTEASTKETVIIVHGTFAAPEEGATRWYQPVAGAPASDGFIAKLDAALSLRGSPARCWAHCSESAQIFHWSGANDWVARTNAAAALRDYVAELQKQGWRCHIVAHSHGGSVVADALSNPSAWPSGPPGRIVTLGTPFMDTMSPILKSAEWREKIADIASWVVVAVILLVFAAFSFLVAVDYVGRPLGYFRDNLFPALFTALVDVLVVAGVAWLVRRRYRRAARIEAPGAGRVAGPKTLPEFLTMGSSMDEPWQLLHYLRNADDPLRIQSNPLSYALSVLRSNISNRSDIARIRGAKTYRDFAGKTKAALWALHLLTVFAALFGIGAWLAYQQLSLSPDLGWAALLAFCSGLLALCIFVLLGLIAFLTNSLGAGFYSAYVSPFRWCVRQLMCLGSIFTALTTYIVRRRAWPMLQAIAMGLEDYQYKLPDVQQAPSLACVGAIKYEPMPTAAEQRALAMRSAWISRHLGDVSQTFASLAVKTADITSLLRAVEADQSLVHGAYYTDDHCIARIADWIAGKG